MGRVQTAPGGRRLEILSRILAWGGIGAVAFWASPCIVHLIAGAGFNGRDAVVLTIAASVSTPAALYLTWVKAPAQASSASCVVRDERWDLGVWTTRDGWH